MGFAPTAETRLVLNSFCHSYDQAATGMAAVVTAQAGLGLVVSPAEASAAEGSPQGLPSSGYFVQHAVFQVG